MTIEEKAKAYDEALERAKKLLITKVAADIFPELKDENKTLNNDDYAFLRDCARVLKTYGWQSYADRLISLCPTVGEEVKDMISTPIIPKESEDERIRKEIIVFLKSDARTQVIPTKQYELWLTWLEKQESLQTNNPNLKWSKEAIKVMDDIVKDKEIEFGSSDNPAESSRLANEYNLLTILKKRMEEPYTDTHYTRVANEIGWLEKIGEEKPIDINPSEFNLRLSELLKQFENLPKEELVDGLSFYLNVVENDGKYIEKQGEQKEPKRIIDEKQIRKNLQDNSFRRMFEQKPAWSEEDEEKINGICMYIMCSNSPEGYTEWIDFLKSLKDRVQPKEGWSEEDEKKRKRIIHRLSIDGTINNKDLADINDWLKSLRPQNHNKWHSIDETPVYPCDILYKASNGNIFLFRYMEGGNPVDHETKRLRSFDDGEWIYLKDIEPQPHWRPSEEQMNALWSATEKYLESDDENVRKLRGEVLESLYNDLKKLKG